MDDLNRTMEKVFKVPNPVMILSTLTILCLLSLTNPVSAVDYYWVGGAGNWSDIRHWVTTSGGTVQHPSVPSTGDNVFFDELSFTAANQTVVIDFPLVFCRSMDWTGATNQPELSMPESSILNVGGSLILQENMSWTVEGDVHLVGTETGFSINTGGHSIRRQLIFDAGGSGAWTLDSDLIVDSVIVFRGGNWLTADFNVTCERFQLIPGVNSNLDLGFSTFTITGFTINKRLWNEDAAFLVRTDNLSINASETTFEFTAPISDIRAFGAAILNLGHIVFRSPVGLSSINDHRYSPNPAGGFARVSFQSLTFGNNGFIGEISEMGALTLDPGKSYIFKSDQTIGIESITASGSCAEPISIYSEFAGSKTTWQASGNQTVEYVNVRGIKVDAGTYMAAQSIDLGNTSGWQFTERIAGSLYWIGGNGSWSDPMHWSLSSGGPPAGCIPSAVDDVYFDNNSFPANRNRVLVDIEDVLCHSMFWTADGKEPALQGPPDRNIHIFGSLILQADLDMQYQGEFVFESGEVGQTITSNGIIMPDNVLFNGVGEYILQDGMEVRDSILFNSGTLNTNNQNLTMESFISQTRNRRRLLLGSSMVTVRAELYEYVRWLINAVGFELDAGTSTIELQSEFSGSSFDHYEMNSDLYYYNVLLNSSYDNVYQFGEGDRLHVHYMEFFSSGGLVGDLSIETLKFNAGYAYTFGQKNSTNYFEVDTLLADGMCDRHIRIQSFRESVPITLASDFLYDVNYVILHSIDFESVNGPATANQSLEYESEGWIFPEESQGRELYWVDDGGEWYDRSHWSLTSGGPGGECIPTPIDDVYFDDNSFSIPGQIVRNYPGYFEPDCHTLLWTVSDPSHELNLTRLNLYGSISIRSGVNNFYIGDLDLRGSDMGNIIDLRDHYVHALNVKGPGSWKVSSDFRCTYILLYRGTLDLGDETNIEVEYSVNCPWDAVDATLIGGTAYVRIMNDGFFFNTEDHDFTLLPDQFTIEFAGAFNYLRTSFPRDFHNVIFSNSSGQGQIETNNWDQSNTSATFNRLEFKNNGLILDQNEIDSLLFTPGHIYSLESQKEQIINDHWRIRGNNCGRIQLRSTIVGSRSTTRMNAGEVNGDFIQMSDQQALGGAEFNAGSRSTNVNNSNEGWIFDTNEDFVDYGILGEDIVLCQMDSLILNQDGSIGASTYSWQDGTTDPFFKVSQPGLYFLEATFDADGAPCIFSDSIYIIEPSDFQIDLGNDPVLCAGEIAALDGFIDLVGVSYLWDDGLEDPIRTVDQPGTYELTATLTGCTTTDSVEVIYVAIPQLNENQTDQACEGDVVSLDVSIPDASYNWSTGATTSAIQVTTSGAYGVSVIADGCEVSDTFQITFVAPPIFDLGSDITECQGKLIRLDASTPNATYRWDDSSGVAAIEFEAMENIVRYVDVSFGSCSSRDSVLVEVLPMPELNISEDQTICPGDLARIDIEHNGDSIIWSTGTSNDFIETDQPGVYTVTVLLDGCTNAASSMVNLYETAFRPLPADTTICDDRSVLLDVGIANGSYNWSDGSMSSTLEAMGGSYDVEVDDGNCIFNDSIFIDTRSCIYFSAYHPNAFTPNSDGVNDEWRPLISDGINIGSYQLQVFNRWGGLIFQTNDPLEAWDGITGGKLQPTGVYLGSIVMDYTDDNGSGSYEQASDFMLIR